MDFFERWDDLQENIMTGVERGLSETWTALPVIIVEDSDGHTCKVQPAIQGKITDIHTGEVTDQTIAEIHDVPVHFPSGGGFTITHPIKKADEGVVVISARNIDNWYAKGGVQPQKTQRWHNLSDAMYIPGVRSLPRKLGGS